MNEALFRKILLAYDGSTGANRALDVAIGLAQFHRAELWALAVEEQIPHFAATIGEVVEEKEYANHYYDNLLATASERAARSGVGLNTVIRPGHPARTIVAFAKEGDFDLVIVGHSGHSEVWAMLLGTTAERVSRHAPCSVLIVR